MYLKLTLEPERNDLEEDTSTSPEVESGRHYKAALLALFVTVLWSSSFIIIKFGLQEIPPLTFSGLRYTIAAFVLLSLILSNSTYRASVKHQTRRWWVTLAVYGVIFISVTQGAQFIGLFYLEAITVSMLLNLTPILVLVFGSLLLRETPAPKQIAWILIGVAGAMVYFYPVNLPFDQMLGVTVVLFGVLANALSSILGRNINKKRDAPPIVVTGISMAIGSVLLLVAGILTEGEFILTPLSLLYILWLSVVNTALAFTLWNKAMQTLRAVDITIINSTMLPQIAILSFFFLGERPNHLDWLGLALVGFSVLFVQVSQAASLMNQNSDQDE